MTSAATSGTCPAHPCLHQIDEHFHDRLAEFWPEPREQLHAGGWAATYALVEKLGLGEASLALDACCGEGGTGVWLASRYGNRVIGVDIVERAIAAATVVARDTPRARFVVADLFRLPFSEGTFDVVYGQDPDGFAHQERRGAFEECFRVLRPAGRIGFQHWLLHDGAPQKYVDAYDQTNADLGFPSMRRLLVSHYLADLTAAGFSDVVVEDMSDVYRRHLEGLEQRAMASGHIPDAWTALSLEIIRSGCKIGAGIIATKRVG
jgi:ubiquinone/menaquinone biosynthesis C-methylase UbiE